MSDYHEGLEEGIKIGRAESAAEIAALQKRCEEAERTALQAAECHARETRRADALQRRVAELEGVLERLARLGAEPYYGNSDGNMIARAALTGGKDAL